MKRLALAFVILFVLAPFAFAMDRTITVRWDAPTHFATGGDCAANTEPLGTEAANVLYQIKWQVNGGPEQGAGTALNTFDIPNVPAGASLTVKVWSYLPGGPVSCFDETSFTVPVPAVCAPTNTSAKVK